MSKNQSRHLLLAEALGLVVVVGFIDYLMGYEVTIFPFYAIPILLAVWFGDPKLAILVSLSSAAAWWFADTASGHIYSREWRQPWDNAVRVIFLGLVAFAGALVKQQRDLSRARGALLERLHGLEREVIGISEQERQRLGRDLHDGVCQYLAAIGFTTGLLKRQLESVSPAHAKLADEIAHRLNDAVVRTRDLSRGLSPVARGERGLESALDDLAITSSRLMGIECQFVCPQPVLIEDNKVSVHLLRIAQEAINNATKHGRATAIIIALLQEPGGMTLSVCDNGSGFAGVPESSHGIGLRIMAYRARSIGGTLGIRQNAPSGTAISCSFRQSGVSSVPT